MAGDLGYLMTGIGLICIGLIGLGLLADWLERGNFKPREEGEFEE